MRTKFSQIDTIDVPVVVHITGGFGKGSADIRVHAYHESYLAILVPDLDFPTPSGE